MRLPFIAHKYHLWLALLVTLLGGLWSLRVTYDFAQGRPDTDIVAGDTIDNGIIVHGLESTPRWQDTLAWWTGPWVAGKDCAFYRPLTSCLWWLEFHVFGRQGLYGFTLIHALSHLGVLALALCFLRELLGLKVATWSVCLYALDAPLLTFELPAAIHALPMWKNSADVWCAAAYVAAAWCFLRFIRGGSRWCLGGAMGCFLLALSFKEMAYTLPLICLLLLWQERKLAAHWRWAAPFYVVAVGAFAFRCWALQGGGFRFGTNGSWPVRWCEDVIGGAPAAEILQGQCLPLALACVVAAALWGFTGASRWWQVGLVVVAGASIGASVQQTQGFEDPFYFQLAGSVLPWQRACSTLALLFLIWRCVANRQRGQIFAWLFVVITYLPLMTAPITPHALYLVALGWSIWLAYALMDIIDFCYKSPAWRFVMLRARSA